MFKFSKFLFLLNKKSSNFFFKLNIYSFTNNNFYFFNFKNILIYYDIAQHIYKVNFLFVKWFYLVFVLFLLFIVIVL